jgi:ADP-ribosylglycohydrolase
LAKRIERALKSIEGSSDGNDASFLIDTARGTDPRDAAEILASGLALFRLSGARVEQAVVWSVNLGLGADARAYVAGGLAGALSGIAAVPPAWVETVSAQVVDDPYTVSQRTPAEAAAGLHRGMVAAAERGIAQLRELAFAPAG